MTESYSAPLRLLHWLMAAIIFAALAIGVYAIYQPRGEWRSELLTVHKSLGVTALVLLALRVLARFASMTPAYVPPLGPLNHIAAASAHGLLYVVMLALPLSGYIHSMAGGHEFAWFGLFPVPDLAPRDKALDAGAGQAHYVLAWIIGALLVAHLGAVWWHRRVKHDRVLARMWPGAA